MGAIPIETGIPVHCLIVFLISKEYLSKSNLINSSKSKKTSSIHYISISCINCHAFQEPDPDVEGPDLTGYGSRQWIIDFVKNPEHEKFYPESNDRMPSFGTKKILTEKEIGLIADWIRDDYFKSSKSSATN